MSEHEQRRLHAADLELLLEVRDTARLILEKIRTMATQLSDLNTAIDGLTSDVTALETELTTAQQAAANNQPVDLSGAIQRLNALKTSIESVTTAAAPAPTPTPTPAQ